MSDTGFWSRRKAAVEAEARADEAELRAAERVEQEAALEARSDEEILAELNLPDPDEMTRPDEVQALLKSAVPQRLRTRALRRLWRLNPVLANVDGLVDYGGDFTDAANVVENLQTAYQVGKGMLKSIEAYALEEAEKLDAEERAARGEDEADIEAPDEVETEPLHTAEQTIAPAPQPVAAPELPQQETTVAHAPRRMRFSFDGAAT